VYIDLQTTLSSVLCKCCYIGSQFGTIYSTRKCNTLMKLKRNEDETRINIFWKYNNLEIILIFFLYVSNNFNIYFNLVLLLLDSIKYRTYYIQIFCTLSTKKRNTIISFCVCADRNTRPVCWVRTATSGSYEEFVFWDIMSCSLVKVSRHFGGTYRLHAACYVLFSCLPYSSTLKMEAICYSKRWLNFSMLYFVISQEVEPFTLLVSFRL
jgi:hypothetical protein